MTGLTRWKEAISEKEHFPIPQTFVLDLLSKLPHADIADGRCKLAIPLHSFDVQIFEHHHLGAEWSIDLGGLLDQLLGLFLLGLGFRSGQQRGQMGLETDTFTLGEWGVHKRTGCLVESILTNSGNTSMEAGNLHARFLAVL